MLCTLTAAGRFSTLHSLHNHEGSIAAHLLHTFQKISKAPSGLCRLSSSSVSHVLSLAVFLAHLRGQERFSPSSGCPKKRRNRIWVASASRSVCSSFRVAFHSSCALVRERESAGEGFSCTIFLVAFANWETPTKVENRHVIRRLDVLDSRTHLPQMRKTAQKPSNPCS